MQILLGNILFLFLAFPEKGINACVLKTTRTWVWVSSGWTHVSGGELPPRRSKCRAICSTLWPPQPLQYFIITLFHLRTWFLKLVHFTLSVDMNSSIWSGMFIMPSLLSYVIVVMKSQVTII